MHKRRIKLASTSIFILILLIAVSLSAGCRGGKSARAPKPKPPHFTSEELSQGLVVTRLMGSAVVKLADGVQLEPPPYEFFLTLANPGDQPEELMFSSADKVDLVVKKGDVEIFRYSKRYPAKGNPEQVELKPKNKRAWRMQWDGKLTDGKMLGAGVYSLEFILNTEPSQTVAFSNITFKFPEEEPPEK